MKNAPMGYIKKPDAAKLMGVTVRSIDNWMKAGLVTFYKFGRNVYFKESDLMESIESGKVDRTSE